MPKSIPPIWWRWLLVVSVIGAVFGALMDEVYRSAHPRLRARLGGGPLVGSGRDGGARMKSSSAPWESDVDPDWRDR